MLVRILIADDHTLLRSGLRTVIETCDDMVLVGEAATSRQAVDLASALQPDVILLDISMPDLLGTKAIRPIRKLCPDSKIIILTMHDDETYVRSALASGAAGYLVKTGAPTTLIDAIRDVNSGRTVVDLANGSITSTTALPSGRRTLEQLSDRERQVLELLAYGYTNREIAERLAVSTKSVDTYKYRLGGKLGLHRRADLVRYAIDNGIL